MLIKLTDFKTKEPVLINTDHIVAVKRYVEDATVDANGIHILGTKAKPKVGSLVLFPHKGGQAIVQETADEIYRLG